MHPIIAPLVIDIILYVGISYLTAPVPKEIEHKFFEEIEDFLLEHTARERAQAAAEGEPVVRPAPSITR